MKRGIILAAVAGLMILAGCKNQAKQNYTIHLTKWEGTPYHIAFDTKATKPSTAGITIPAISYTANPDALEKRACLLVRFDSPNLPKDQTVMNQLVMGPVDISGTQGTLPASYMEATDQGLARLLEAYKVKGKVKVSVLLAMSSIPSQPSDSDIVENRLSDWKPIELDYKAPHRR